MDNVTNTVGSSIPLPNIAGGIKPATGGGTYAGLIPIPVTENEYLGKYDQNLGSKDHVAATYFFSRNVLKNNPGGNVPWTYQSGRLEWHQYQPQRRSHLQPNHCQSDLAHVHAGSGRPHQPAGDRPGVADPGIVWLELPPPGPGLSAQYLSIRRICSGTLQMRVRSRAPTTMSCATWSA